MGCGASKSNTSEPVAKEETKPSDEAQTNTALAVKNDGVVAAGSSNE